MDLPRVFIISTSNVENAKNIAREIESEHIGDDEKSFHYKWTIDNKYYEAKVLLSVTDASPKDILPCADVQAIILHHDPKKTTDTKCLDDYLPLLTTFPEADVFLLACEPFEDSDTRTKVTEWSLANKFELVQMGDSDDSETMEEELECNNLNGIERIVEALHTHLWPNRVLKAQVPNSRIDSPLEVDTVEDQLENMRLHSEIRDTTDKLAMESMLDGMLGEDDVDFGELMGRVMDMRKYVTSLPRNHRHAAAAQLAALFWKTMGGDPSEVEDMDQ